MNSHIPPPLPPDEAGAQLPRQVAKASVIAPLIAFAFTMAVGAYRLSNKEAELSPKIAVLVGAIVLLILVAGTISAIVALASVPRHGRTGLLAPGIGGLLLNGVILILFTIGGITGYENAKKRRAEAKQELNRVDSALKNIQNDIRKQTQSKDGMVSSKEHLKRMEKEYEKAGQNLTGVEKQIMQVNAAFAKKTGAESAKFEAVAKAFRQASVLSPKSNDTLEKIARNRTLLETFLSANQAFGAYLQKGEQTYATIIQEIQVPEPAAHQVLAGFSKTFTVQKPFLAEIRACDTRVAKAALGILDIFESQFGQWHIQDDGKIVMSDDASIEKYNSLLAEIDTAIELQVATQQKLLNRSK